MKALLLCLLLLVASPGIAAPITNDTPAGAFNAQGNAAYDAKNYAGAAALFQKAATLVPGEVNYVTNLASAQREAGEFAEAQKLLQGALESFTDPGAINKLEIALADNHFYWARALVKSDKRADAIAHYQAAAGIDRTRRPKDAGYDLSNLGSSFHILGRDAESLAAYQESLTRRRALPAADQDKDDEASSLEGIITANLALNSYDSAASAYEELRRLKPDAAPEYEALLLTTQAEAHGPNGQNAGAKAAASALNRLGIADYAAKRYDKAIPSYRRAMELRPTVEAYVLNLARAFNGAKRYSEAIVLIETKVAMFPDPADRKELLIEWADAQDGVGQSREGEKRWADAIPFYLSAYSVDRIVRRKEAALELYNIAENARWLRRFLEAQKFFRQSAQIAHEIQYPEREAYSLTELARTYANQEQFAAAMEVFQQALSISHLQKLRLNEALILQAMGVCANSLSRYAEAQKWHQQSLAIDQELGDRPAEAAALNNLGVSSASLGLYTEALRFYTESLSLQRMLHNPSEEASILGNIGGNYYQQGRYAEAIAYYRRAMDVPGPDGKRQEQPVYLNDMAIALNGMGRHRDAIRLILEALNIYHRRDNRDGEASCLGTLGASFFALGDYSRAADFFRQGLALHRTTGNREGEATALNNLGFLYDTLGQLLKASDFYGQSLTIRRAINDRSGEANTLSCQAGIFAEQGSTDPAFYAKAVALCEQALALNRLIGNADGEGESLNNLGSLSVLQHHPDEARKFFEEALASRRHVGNRDAEGMTLGNLAYLADSQRHPIEAKNYYEQSLAISLETGHKDDSQVTWGALMNLASANGNPGWAIYCGKQSVNILQSLRGSLKSFDKGVQKNYLNHHSSNYRTLAKLLIRQGRLDEAQQVLGMLKEEEFFDFLGRDPSAAKTLTASATLTPFEADWQAKFQKATTRAAFLGDMEHAFQVAAPVQASVSQRKTLPAGTVTVYTIVEPDQLQLILTTPTGQVAREYPIAAPDLYRKVLALRNALQDPTRDPRPLAQELYKIVVGPIEADLKTAHATTLLWSLDDALRYLPVAALYDGNHYLVERYDNALLTLAAPTRAASATGVPWTGLGLGVSLQHPGFDALPGVRAELSGIFGPVVPGTALLDTEFTQRSFLAGLKRRNHPLVHIASHFSLSGRDTDSFLLLGDGGHLTLADLKADPNVFQGVDLLTLSACNTAMEVRSASGKEVEGFGALAQRLGARSVLASLWPVADASTPTLMREFYRLRHANPKLGKAAGLRQAQLELLRGKVTASTPPSKANRAKRAKVAGAANTDLPLFTTDPKAPYANPFYWAPFVLIGNPQ